jgi:hypothetical protein
MSSRKATVYRIVQVSARQGVQQDAQQRVRLSARSHVLQMRVPPSQPCMWIVMAPPMTVPCKHMALRGGNHPGYYDTGTSDSPGFSGKISDR